MPNTDADRKKMLAAIGVSSFEDLLDAVPEEVRLKEPLKIPAPASELELFADLRKLSRQNVPVSVANSFLGGGFYDHFTPAAADFIIRRPEFLTSYTPYQAEVAQGTLQVIYEFQSLVCALTQMEAANASLYDGGSATAEAALLTAHLTGRKEVLVTEGLNPNYLKVLKTYGTGGAYQVRSLPLGPSGQLEPEVLKKSISEKTAALILQSPNFFGCLEEAKELEPLVHAAGAKLIAVFDPISLGIVAPPGEYNADIAVAEGQSLGVPISYGGPAIGLFVAKKELVRRMPGRIAARTTDSSGKIGYVLTLQTREQHIRREKATSNICTNQGLMATLSTVFMSLVGKEGFLQMARLSYAKAHHTAGLLEAKGFKRAYSAPFFKEFALELPVPAAKVVSRLWKANIFPGIDLGRYDRKRKNELLIAVTEKKRRADIEALAEGMSFFRFALGSGLKPEKKLETAGQL